MPPEETQGVTQCSQHFYAHEESLRQNKEDIKSLTESLSGIPTDIKHILEAIGKLNDFTGKLDEKYASKEYMAIKMETLEDKIKLWVICGGLTILAGTPMAVYYISHIGR